MYSEITKKKILEMYEPCNRVAAEASRRLADQGIEFSPDRVRAVWREARYELNKVGGKRPHKVKIDPEKRDYIISTYSRYRGFPSLAAKSLGHNSALIARVWREAGLKVELKPGRRRFIDDYF